MVLIRPSCCFCSLSLAVKLLHKSAGLDLAQQPRVDKVFRVSAFGARVGLTDLGDAKLHVFGIRIRKSLEGVGVDPLSLRARRAVCALSIFSDDVHRKVWIGLESMHRFDVGLEE